MSEGNAAANADQNQIKLLHQQRQELRELALKKKEQNVLENYQRWYRKEFRVKQGAIIMDYAQLESKAKELPKESHRLEFVKDQVRLWKHVGAATPAFQVKNVKLSLKELLTEMKQLFVDVHIQARIDPLDKAPASEGFRGSPLLPSVMSKRSTQTAKRLKQRQRLREEVEVEVARA